MNSTLVNSTTFPSNITTSDTNNQFNRANVIAFRAWKEGRSPILKKLQEVVGGLLLLRGAIGQDDARELMQKLLAESFLDEERDDTAILQNSDTVSDEGGVNLIEVHTNNPPALSRQPTLEANRAPRRSNFLTAYDPASERSKILREAFGSNALAHTEFRIDLFTAFTELTIFIKLVSVYGNGWFTAAALFLVSGWSAVQTLLLLFHLQEMSESEMAAAVRIARNVNDELKEQAGRWNALFIVLHLPFFGYPSYLASFHLWFSENVTGFVSFLKNCGWLLGFIVSLVVAKVTFWCALFSIFIALAPKSPLVKLLSLLTFPVLSAWLFVSSVSYIEQNCGDMAAKYCVKNFTSFFEPQRRIYYIVGESFDVLYKG